MTPASRRAARGVGREERERVGHRERFGRRQLDAVDGGAGDGGYDRGERLGRCHWRVGRADEMDVGVLQAARAIEMRDEAGLTGVLGPRKYMKPGLVTTHTLAAMSRSM